MTTPCTKNATYEISKKPPNQNSIDILVQTTKALFVANSKLSTNAHLVQICPKHGRGRYVLFFIITNDDLCNYSRVGQLPLEFPDFFLGKNPLKFDGFYSLKKSDPTRDNSGHSGHMT